MPEVISVLRVVLLSMMVALLKPVAAQVGPDTSIPTLSYTHAQQLVPIDGNRKLNLFCLGQGAPVVVFDSGLGGDSADWQKVQGSVARVTTACSYDRAGYGFSDPATRPSDARNTVDDLHHLLAAARLARPVVLVGHSVAGRYATLYAAMYPQEVAGMVLVDPSFPQQDHALSKDWTPRQKEEGQAQKMKYRADAQQCLEQARSGELAKPENQSSPCLDNPPDPDPILHTELNRQWARPSTLEANMSEQESALSPSLDKDSLDDDQAAAMPFSFGAKPLIVLTAGNMQVPPDWTPEQVKTMRDAWKQGHDALATHSTHASSLVVPDAEHYIQKDQPNAVIAAIQQVVDEVRGKGH